MKQKYLISTVFTLFPLLITACTVSEEPPQTLTEKLGNPSIQAPQYTADLNWWTNYHNEELNKIVTLALQNNPDYLKAVLEAEKALYSLKLSASDLFPTLSGTADASSQTNTKNGDSTRSFGGSLNLKYEVDLYGKIRDSYSAQEFETQASAEDREAARLTLINSTIDLFFQLSYLNNAILLSQENIKSYQEIQKITEQKYKSGKTDNLELAQANQSLLSEKNRLLELQTQFKQTEQSLKNILNTKDDLNITYPSLTDQKTGNIDLNVPLSVLANRPDLKASQYRLEKAFKNLSAEQKNWYPNISLNGALSTSSDHARTTFDIPYVFGSISVDLPFLDWNRVQNNIRISETDYKIARIDFQNTLNQAINETAYYYFAYTNMLNIYKNTQENYQNALKITGYYQIRYQNGKAEFKDLLEAIYTQNERKKELVEQKYQIIQYENAVYKAMGGRYVSNK